MKSYLVFTYSELLGKDELHSHTSDIAVLNTPDEPSIGSVRLSSPTAELRRQKFLCGDPRTFQGILYRGAQRDSMLYLKSLD